MPSSPTDTATLNLNAASFVATSLSVVMILTFFVFFMSGSLLAVIVFWMVLVLSSVVLWTYGFISNDLLQLFTYSKPPPAPAPDKPEPGSGLVGMEVFHIDNNRFTYDEQNFSGTNRTDLGWVLQARAAVNPVTARDDINSEDGTVRTVVYLGPSLANATTAAGANLQGIQTELNPANVTGWAWDPTSRTFVTRPVEVSRIINDDVFYNQSSGGSLVRQVISSQSAVHQARWLKGEWIVSTLGWRKDEVKSYRKNADNDVRNQYNFIDRASPNFRLPSIPGSVFEQAIWSHGIVVHRPPFLKIFRSVDFSVFYSKSENFQPADARISIFGQPIEPPGGTTNDRGFTLGFLGGKISTRFNWFETASARATDTYPGFLIETDARIMRYNTPAALAAAGYKGPPQFLKTLVNWQEFSGPPHRLGPQRRQRHLRHARQRARHHQHRVEGLRVRGHLQSHHPVAHGL